MATETSTTLPPAAGGIDIPRQRRGEPPVRHHERNQSIVAVFDEHYVRLCRLAVLVGAEADAEDVVAEAFYELHRRWHDIEDSTAAVGYLSSTIRNLIRMRIRHKQVVRRHEQRIAPDVEHDRSAEQEVLVRVGERTVLAALLALPPRQREAIVLRYWMDLTDAEIAAAMGISRGSVKVHISRGLAGLKGALCGQDALDAA